MVYKTGIRVTGKCSREMTEPVIEFTAAEWQLLQRYLREVKALRATRFVEQRSGVNLNLKVEKDLGVSWSVLMPPVDDLLAFLHRLRPLILEGEQPSFLKARKVIARKLKGTANPLLRYLLDLFKSREMQKIVVMQSNDQVMNSEEMVFTWLNAHEYHRDSGCFGCLVGPSQ